MIEQQLRNKIIEACKYLQDKGLIARTWGNVSARLSPTQFIITPSGLSYDLTKPEDLVIVDIKDCKYADGQRKPSSEKKVHAAAYACRPDVNFIVHTHQHFASAICADEISVTLTDGTFVPCAKYGLPGTDKLKANCEKAYKDNLKANSFLMAKHGVICFGTTMQEALDNADKLEIECEKLFKKRVKQFYVPQNMKAYLDDYAQMYPLIDSKDLEAAKMVQEKNAAASLYAINAKPLGFIDTKIQHLVYKLNYSKLKDK